MTSAPGAPHRFQQPSRVVELVVGDLFARLAVELGVLDAHGCPPACHRSRKCGRPRCAGSAPPERSQWALASSRSARNRSSGKVILMLPPSPGTQRHRQIAVALDAVRGVGADEPVLLGPVIRLQEGSGEERLRGLHGDHAGQRLVGAVERGEVLLVTHRDRPAVFGGGGDDVAEEPRPGQRAGRVVDHDDIDLAGGDGGRERLERHPLRGVPAVAAGHDLDIGGPHLAGRVSSTTSRSSSRTTRMVWVMVGSSRAQRIDQVKTRRPARGSSTLLVWCPVRRPSPAASITNAARGRRRPGSGRVVGDDTR